MLLLISIPSFLVMFYPSFVILHFPVGFIYPFLRISEDLCVSYHILSVIFHASLVIVFISFS